MPVALYTTMNWMFASGIDELDDTHEHRDEEQARNGRLDHDRAAILSGASSDRTCSNPAATHRVSACCIWNRGIAWRRR